MAESKNKTSFEENIKSLEAIVRALEEGNMPLEESISAYEEGMKLCAACSDTIEECRQRIVKINMSDGKETEIN